MGRPYLLDTNILIYYFNDSMPETALDFDHIFRDSFNISVISKIEFLGWRSFHEQQYPVAKNAISSAHIFHLTEEIIERTISLRRKYSVKIPDAIIAATAIENDLTVLTRNARDFQLISELHVHDPFPNA